MPLIEKIQLYDPINDSMLLRGKSVYDPAKQCEILFPPRNCKAPKIPPLWISNPDIPTLNRIEDPSFDPTTPLARTLMIIINKAGINKLPTRINFDCFEKLFEG